MPAFIEVQHAGMAFNTRQGRFHALKDVHLQIQRGEFVTLVGQPGCGKSTLLNLIAGLLLPTEGALICDGREIAAPGPERAVVFQNHALLPWLTCMENVLLAVESVFGGKEPSVRLHLRARAALEQVGMSHALQKRPHEISAGMQQRVGIARALAMEPQVLLMDDPFSAVDALTRVRLQDELLKIAARTRVTVVMVTHDVDEAVLLSDRIVMMANGPATTIAEVLEVGIPRPRVRVELAEDTRYVSARKAVIDFLYTRHAHVEKAA